MSRHRLTAFALVAALLMPSSRPLAADAKDDAVAKDLDILKGAWQLAFRTQDGKATPADTIKNRVITFDAKSYVLRDGDNVIVEATFKIDPSTDPKSFDLTISSEGASKGKSQVGIYKIDGDSISFCISGIGDPRPGDFTCKPGSGRTLTTYTRMKK